ncbi:GNAT family N-acetyltransferase [Prauserella endophytica]|uniref:GNAT family N-acetyltransferase n=1 Tax=Prauserella endophytica TaxID=1592324 RepID=A0ABY2S9L4_9PSEU|nr:GNAT family N-acetyltransferase [Prauserella endophytica]TKG72577.1 GNAT family N-acetyltransferase [Prauserella endophytica]
MLVRDATADDWPGIWPIWHRIAVEGETIAWHPDTGYDQARASWLLDPPGRTYVAHDAGRIVGSAQLKPHYGPASHVANAAFIVDPDRREQGIGRALARHVLGEARDEGYRSMVFNAVVETNHGAVRLYRSLGFRILTIVPEAFAHPRHGLVGMHVMYLPLEDRR